MDSLWTDLVDKLVDEPDVGEGSSGHDLVVSSSGTIGVVVLCLDASGFEVCSGWRVAGNLTCWRDVVGGDGVTEVQEDVAIDNALDWGGLGLSGLEERWIVDVC